MDTCTYRNLNFNSNAHTDSNTIAHLDCDPHRNDNSIENPVADTHANS